MVVEFFKHVYIRNENDAIVADSLEEFMTKITDPCHIWRGKTNNAGYGIHGLYSTEHQQSIMVKAHRFAYAIEHGFDALPPGVYGAQSNVLNHLCHNRACVNVKHLEVITHAENNSRDKRKPINV
jgi:hypothetical protein